MRWRRGRRRDDLRPTYEERRAAVARLRGRVRLRQGADAPGGAWRRRAVPTAAAAAFAAGLLAGGPLLREAAAARPELFVVRHLAVVGAERLRPEDLLRAAGPGAEHLAPSELAARIARHPWVASARAARVSPDTVVIRIVERVPAAVWLGADGEARLVDAGGTPFAPAGPAAAQLPRLRLAARIQPGAADPRLAAGIGLVRALEAAGWAAPEIDLDGPDPNATPSLRLAGVGARILLGPGDVGGKLERLAHVLADLPASHTAGEIDLRFAGQVVLRPAPPRPEGTAGAGPGAGAAGVPDEPGPSGGDGGPAQPGAAG
jgi:hypothetical protein